jgi:hypothetical protein
MIGIIPVVGSAFGSDGRAMARHTARCIKLKCSPKCALFTVCYGHAEVVATAFEFL